MLCRTTSILGQPYTAFGIFDLGNSFIINDSKDEYIIYYDAMYNSTPETFIYHGSVTFGGTDFNFRIRITVVHCFYLAPLKR